MLCMSMWSMIIREKVHIGWMIAVGRAYINTAEGISMQIPLACEDLRQKDRWQDNTLESESTEGVTCGVWLRPSRKGSFQVRNREEGTLVWRCFPLFIFWQEAFACGSV